jgi:hypothetical protein
LDAAEKAGKETPDANEAFTAIQDRLQRYCKDIPESQKLLDAFLHAGLKDRTTTAAIKAAEKTSSPPVSALYTYVEGAQGIPPAQTWASQENELCFSRITVWGRTSPCRAWLVPAFFQRFLFILRISLEEIDDPTTIPQMLWAFSRKRSKERIPVTLKENPHFYLKIPQNGDSDPGFDSWEDGKGFHREPLTQIGFGLEEGDTVYVLWDKPCRLYVDVAKPRVFGNLWQPQKKIILKGAWVFLTH